MPAALLFIAIILGLVVMLPSVWVKRQLRRHHHYRSDFPGTGGELAEHLLEKAGMHHYMVEPTEEGMDRYDPTSNTIFLSRSFYTGKSISSVAVAAHEFSHALQHARSERLFQLRMSLIKGFAPINKIVGLMLIAGPLIGMSIRMPSLGLVFVALAVLTLIFELVVHLITLPVELDASFNKALPILEGGGYLRSDDLPAARAVLRAAAWTYVAQAFAGVFNIFRLLRLGR